MIDSLKLALERRTPLFEDKTTNCFRLFSGEKEGVPGLVAELWKDRLVLQIFENRYRAGSPFIDEVEELYRSRLPIVSVHRKEFLENRNQATPQAANESPVQVLENGHTFEIRVGEPFSVGLFMDQRENRRKIGELASGKRVLNLFAYTCGFSVYAAKAGASEVVSCDVSGRYLDWGKQNFALNALDPSKAFWFKDDAFAVLTRLGRQGRRFDLIVCDPPTFSRTKRGEVFRVASDLPRLISSCVEVAAPGALLFASSNYAEWSKTDFQGEIAKVVGGNEMKLPPPPLDFGWEREPLNAVLLGL